MEEMGSGNKPQRPEKGPASPGKGESKEKAPGGKGGGGGAAFATERAALGPPSGLRGGPQPPLVFKKPSAFFQKKMSAQCSSGLSNCVASHMEKLRLEYKTMPRLGAALKPGLPNSKSNSFSVARSLQKLPFGT